MLAALKFPLANMCNTNRQEQGIVALVGCCKTSRNHWTLVPRIEVLWFGVCNAESNGVYYYCNMA